MSQESFIPFSLPSFSEKETSYVTAALAGRRISGDNSFTKRCHQWLSQRLDARKPLLTTSGTHALEMAALLLRLQPGDEVILPSFTFSSCANAFALRGATLKFVDIRPDTMNLDETRVEEAITPKTKLILPVHYAGVPCEMKALLALGKRYGVAVVEDAAQAILSTYEGKAAGTLGSLGAFSFHETKNLTCGEGGALLVNDPQFDIEAEIIREKGTNRSQFFRGEVDKYSWLECGSSFLPSELCSAVLLAQFERADEISSARKLVWDYYYESLKPLAEAEQIALPIIPRNCTHNAHIFGIRTRSLDERTKLLSFLKGRGIAATFHYVPLHSSPAGLKHGVFVGEDRFTTTLSERLIRLPLWPELPREKQDFILESIFNFFDHELKISPSAKRRVSSAEPVGIAP